LIVFTDTSLLATSSNLTNKCYGLKLWVWYRLWRRSKLSSSWFWEKGHL